MPLLPLPTAPASVVCWASALRTDKMMMSHRKWGVKRVYDVRSLAISMAADLDPTCVLVQHGYEGGWVAALPSA
jgi:hypothetical protein